MDHVRDKSQSLAIVADRPTRVCDVATVRGIEQRAFKERQSFDVMVDAATQVAKACSDLPDPLLFVAGKGNNGGDACVAAAQLLSAGRKVHLWRPLGSPRKGGDAAKAAKKYADVKGMEVDQSALDECGAVVDGLFGIGLDRDLDAKAASCVEKINSSGKPVLAIDVPSGLDSDTGTVMGVAVRSAKTVTFFCHKPGLLMRSGRDLAGEVQVADLGYASHMEGLGGEVIDGPIGVRHLKRSADSHKGSHGSLAVIGGSTGMLGALMLATRAAVAHGSGKVCALETGESSTQVDLLRPEIMWRDQIPEGITAAAVGMGLGVSQSAKKWLGRALELPVPILVDADGLNLLAKDKRMRSVLKKRKAQTVLTPHPAEAARLASCETRDVQADRVGMARQIAADTGCVIALKGSGMVIAGDDRWGIVDSGNPGLAQAGSGDVLSGMIGALLCQGTGAWKAAATGSWLMGHAADMAREKKGGDIGLSLEDIAATSSSLLARYLSA